MVILIKCHCAVRLPRALLVERWRLDEHKSALPACLKKKKSEAFYYFLLPQCFVAHKFKNDLICVFQIYMIECGAYLARGAVTHTQKKKKVYTKSVEWKT